MDFDTVLAKCGNFGRYQMLLLAIYGYTNIMSALHYFSQTIISFTPDHWCYHDKLANLSLSEISQVYASIEKPFCTPLQDVIDGVGIPAPEGTKCKKWIFNYDHGYQSISTELQWVCDGAFQSAMGQSFFYIGAIIGTIFFGFLADRIGRLPTLIITTLSGGLGDFITSFVNGLPAFIAARFLSGLSTDTLFYLMYIMLFEYLDPKKRTFGLNTMTTIFYVSCLVMTPWLAIWIGNWRQYLIMASVPTLMVLLYPVFLCESAQWLITKNNLEGAVRCLKHVARFNKRTVSDDVYREFVLYHEVKLAEERKLNSTKDTFLGLFRTPRLRKFTIILLIKSMIITLSYDIISRNMEGLGSSPFLLFSVTAIFYIPGGLTIIFLQNIIGRKGMACSSLYVGGIITAITGFMIAFVDHEQHAVLLAVMVGLGRYGAYIAYEAEAQYAAELIPSTVRGRGLSNVHVAGYAMSFLTTYIIYLGHYFKPLPSLVISTFMFIGATLCLILPETLNKKLPDNLSEGEEFARDEKWYFFPCISQKKTYKINEIASPS